MRRRRQTSFSRFPRSSSNNRLNPTVIGIIPARYASNRLPGKPLLDLTGKPIIQHVFERARQAKTLNDVLVATDDERISGAVSVFEGKAVMTPTTIQSGSDRAAYAARNLEADVIVNIQGDEPFINPEMIDETVQALIDDQQIEVSTPVRKIDSSEELSNPNVVKVVLDENNYALYFSRSVIPFLRVLQDRQDWTKKHQYYKHIGLYVFRKEFLLTFTQWDRSPLEQAEQLEQLRILEHGYRIKCVITEHDSFSVDTLDDLEHLREKARN
jgi:3-deoxy-manno-octulosonate cytidylyltransferase (CMP-KDO synthetase)